MQTFVGLDIDVFELQDQPERLEDTEKGLLVDGTIFDGVEDGEQNVCHLHFLLRG